MSSVRTDSTALMAFDAGNTLVKLALYVGSGWQVIANAATEPVCSVGERLRASLSPSHLGMIPKSQSVISSVQPAADEGLSAFWAGAGGAERPRLFGRDLPVPMETTVREPAKVGTDRLLCALGARDLAGSPCIVVTAGTAITVDKVDREGRFAGGAIGPGFSLAARCLAEWTACLPSVEPAKPERTAGLDTAEAIRSGVYWFCKGGVLAILKLLKDELGCEDVPVVCAGGQAGLLLPLPGGRQVRHEPELIFHGISVALALSA